MAALKVITGFLDTELKVKDYPEKYSNNGLQVQGNAEVKRIGFAVDACIEAFRLASAKKCDLVVVHHGISFGDSLKYIIGMNHERIKFLSENGIALYAAHLPLDCHPILGNNAQICQMLGISKIKPFGLDGFFWGFAGEIQAMPFSVFL